LNPRTRPVGDDVVHFVAGRPVAGPPVTRYSLSHARLIMNRLLGFSLALILATVVGCQRGDQPKYANVKGTVTYNGKPIDKGQITFALEGRPPSTMDVVGGKYSGQAMVGSNKVSISAKRKGTGPKLSKDAETQVKGYQEKFKAQPGQFGGPPSDYDPSMVEYIPPEWGTRSTQMRVVESGAPNEFNVDVTGKD